MDLPHVVTAPPLRVAVIGTGTFAPFHYDAWTRIDRAQLVALCTHSPSERAREFATRYNVPATYTDAATMLDAVVPDLVDIVTQPDTHLALVRVAAERGIPVVCQKPLAPTLEVATELVEVAEEAGVTLAVHENWRFRPWFREVACLVADGVIGQPEMVSFRFRVGDGRGPDAYLDGQPRYREMPRFLIHEVGIHMVDVFRYLFGEVTGVFARLRRINPVIAGEDAGYVVLRFASGVLGLYDGHRQGEIVTPHKRFTGGHFHLDGSDGYLRVNGMGEVFHKPIGRPERRHDYHFEDRGYSADSVHALQKHVAAHFLDGGPLENLGREYLRNLVVEQAIYRSSELGAWVDLPVGDAHNPSPTIG